MPSNKFQYNQRTAIINEVINKLVKEKTKFSYLTDFCKSIANAVSMKELELYLDNPESFKSKPKKLAYQTLLTNNNYKSLIQKAFDLITDKPTKNNKTIDFEKDLEISNLKEKIRRLEVYISNNNNEINIHNNVKANSDDLENSYKLIQLLTNSFSDFLDIDIDNNKISNLVDLPVSIIAEGKISEGFIKFLIKNNLKKT